MQEEVVPFASGPYWILCGVLLLGRGMDFLSTWIASPNLRLEANPIARKLGWRWGAVVNVALCFGFAFLPVGAIVVATCSCLVAARNFQSACLMRALGENLYSLWYAEQVGAIPPALYLFCLLAQSGLFLLIGLALMLFSVSLIPFAIGLGMVAYAMAVTLFTLLARYRSGH